jgi:hypothetical protein
MWCGSNCTASIPVALQALAEDLEAVLTLADEIRQSPAVLEDRICLPSEEPLAEVRLPTPKPIRQLLVGERFLLAPMFRAAEPAFARFEKGVLIGRFVPSHMEPLIEGRVQKLILSRPVEGAVSECGNCGRVQPRSDGPRIFCLNDSLHDLPADEG